MSHRQPLHAYVCLQQLWRVGLLHGLCVDWDRLQNSAVDTSNNGTVTSMIVLQLRDVQYRMYVHTVAHAPYLCTASDAISLSPRAWPSLLP